MNKIFVVVVIFSFLLASNAYAQVTKIFDLKDQYFSETFVKQGKKHYDEAKYDVGNVIVTTDTRFNGRSYMSGIFTVDVKKPLENWNVNIKKKNGASSRSDITAIRLTSDSGNSYFISYKYQAIQINDKNFTVKGIARQKLTSTISKTGGKVKFSINGKGFLKIDAKDFGNLAKVEVELNDNYYHDELLALEIYKAK